MRAVLLAGGAGTRLWPLSTQARPKQFLRLWGDRSLIQEAWARVRPIASRIVVATGEAYAEATLSDLPDLSRSDLILEPSRRNTAAAVLLSAIALGESSDEPVAVLPADQTVSDGDAFRRSLETAAGASDGEAIVILGVVPARPETEYGYVEVAAGMRGVAAASGATGVAASGAFDVVHFVEKPDREAAEAYRRSGNFFWNAGIFVFRPSAALAAAARACPELLAACRRYHESPSPEGFERIPAISFDYAVMEKADVVRCVPCDAGWNDVGSYRALRELRGADPDGNLIVADRPVVAEGLRDSIVALSPDGLLVFPFAREPELRERLRRLAEKTS